MRDYNPYMISCYFDSQVTKIQKYNGGFKITIAFFITVTNRTHKIVEWFGLEGTLKII